MNLYMKTKKTVNKKLKYRALCLYFVPVVLLSGLAMFALDKYHVINLFNYQDIKVENSNQTNIDYNTPSQEQIDAGNQTKDSSSDQPIRTNSDFSATISSLFSDGTTLHVRAIINGAISSSGTCELTIQRADGTVQKTLTASSYAMPSYTTCQGFDISNSELTKGNLNAILTVTIGGNVSTAEQEYNLE